MPGLFIRRWLAILTMLFMLTLIQTETARSSSTLDLSSPPAQPTREPGMMFDPTDRLAPPPISDPPTQVEQGRYAYYLSCMVCHGDEGQGLTDEWRGALDPADQNCWQSKCHAANHPPEGFELPRYAPPVIGQSRLAHHQTAAALYEYLRARMPWQAPGILTDAEYWQLTAFLVDANGLSLSDTPLGPTNAAFVRLDRVGPAAHDRSGTAVAPLLALIGMLLLSGVMVHRWLAQAG